MGSINALKMQYNREITRESNLRRSFNISAFSKLSREGLEFNKHERRLLLHTTACGEKISIQYPGKETKNGTEDKIRPWDFRPKLTLPTGEDMKDLSFPNIWDDLADLHTSDDSVLAVLAAIFCRMSVMIDHKRISTTFSYSDFDVLSGKEISQGDISFEWYKYLIDMNTLNEVTAGISKIRGASLEAYLCYNDLLVQNEDCKYFYRDEIVNGKTWNSKSGRNNTLLSHLSVIEYLKGEITFSEIMTRFQRGMGVAPITIGRIEAVTGGIIKKQ